MSKKVTSLLDYGIEEEDDLKYKFNSLLSVTVSTVMCLAAKCPLPKSNVETTKLFLRTITDDNGKTPRNIKGFLSLLNEYSGPYETELCQEKHFEKPPGEKLLPEKEEKTSLESVALNKELLSCSEGQTSVKKNTKMNCKKNEKVQRKKSNKHIMVRFSSSKSLISTKT